MRISLVSFVYLGCRNARVSKASTRRFARGRQQHLSCDPSCECEARPSKASPKCFGLEAKRRCVQLKGFVNRSHNGWDWVWVGSGKRREEESSMSGSPSKTYLPRLPRAKQVLTPNYILRFLLDVLNIPFSKMVRSSFASVCLREMLFIGIGCFGIAP